MLRFALLALLPLVLLTALAADEPVKRVSSDVVKAIPKAFAGDEKALEKIRKVGPLTAKAAEEVKKKALGGWRFRGQKGGRGKREIQVDGRKREYGIYVPKRYTSKRSWPLILSLHGAGGNGPGELSFIWSRELSDWPGFVVAPTGSPPGAQWFFDQVPFVLAVLRDVMTSANIDANRVYVHGFSNGGNGAWYYGKYHPGLFAALCTRGGGTPNMELLVNLLHVPAYIIHGENDPVISAKFDRECAEGLEKLGYTYVYKEKKGKGHKPFLEENPEVLKFFKEHPRDPWPKVLRFRKRWDGRFRYLWIDIPAGGERLDVSAEVKEGNVIEIRGVKKVVLWLSDELVDLDREVVVTLDGTEAFRGTVERRLTHLVADLVDRFDRQAPAFARLEVGK